MKLQEIISALETTAPTRLAEAWDNVGLLAGDPQADVSRAMLCIDYTPEVACEAAGEKCELIIAYHPTIFEPIKRLVLGGAASVVFDAIRRGVAIYSPHTALDVADRSEEHTSELQSPCNLVCRLLLEKKKMLVQHSYDHRFDN